MPDLIELTQEQQETLLTYLENHIQSHIDEMMPEQDYEMSEEDMFDIINSLELADPEKTWLKEHAKLNIEVEIEYNVNVYKKK